MRQIFQNSNLSNHLAPLLGEIDICASGLVYKKFNSEQVLFKAFFVIIGNLATFSPNVNVNALCIIIFQKCKSLEPLVPVLGEIDICAYWLFCRKFNSEQVLHSHFSIESVIFKISINEWNFHKFSISSRVKLEAPTLAHRIHYLAVKQLNYECPNLNL